MSKPITLAIHIDGEGAHPSAWRHVDHTPAVLLSGAHVATVVSQAETAGFSIVTFAGGHLPPGASPNITARLDPLQVAAFAGPLTSRVGLVPVVQTTFVEPFHTANQLASLDYVTHGRGGWIVTATGTPDEAHAYGRDPIDDPRELSQEAREVIEVNRLLWDSWEDDAVIRDTATWRYIDRDKLHYADFTGITFSVKGPSYVPRPPQGQLVVFCDDGLVDHRDVDVTIVHAADIARLKAAARLARNKGATRVIADLEVILDSRGLPAAERLAALNAGTTWEPGRDLRIAGSSDDVADVIRDLAEDVDGVRIHPAVIEIDLQELQYAVLPALLRGGVASSPLSNATLRETLGLARPANRFVTR